ncbi:elongation factor G [Acidovorax sp. Be4]|uniref:Elongation factor G n=1 Tax=Acidovorax bellezanensis TaxID=2976702 RepID=A0ABT2PGL0_9BURK|nr:elongation factor G [Acidovorax sp. Be4]MCT9809548.1 elongation factor G [Acidovorax sp. Be4]
MPNRSSGLAAEMQSVRTLALVGAAAAGKSSLAEALLYKAGAIGACGSIERGSTVSDHDPLERRMQHSLNASVMHLTHAGTRIHLIDTPGGPDFLGQSMPALEAVETAAVVINAATGIEPMTVRMMAYAASRRLARMIIVTKTDAQGVSLTGLLADIQATFGRECLPLNLPDRVGKRVVDCFFNRFGQTDFGPVEAAHRALVEQVVEVDAAFVDRYLEDGDMDPAELHAPLEQALREGHLIPVCFVSSRSGAGVAELLDVIVKLLPNPTEANPPNFIVGEGAQAKPMEAKPDPTLHVLAHVFKVTIDPYVGKMGIFRVHQGTVTRDSQLYIGDGRKPFKVGHLFMLQGKDHVEVSHAVPGDIVAVAKVDEIHFDAVLHDAEEDSHVYLAPLAFPVPVYGLAVEPKRHGDEQRAWEILGKLAAEDPCLRLEHVAATNETVLYGLGELHLRIVLERLHEVYRFEVQTRPPRIAYRETVTAPAKGHHRHKKQSGGAGQFAEVFLRIEPLARGAGFEFADEVRGGTIPGQFIPAIEKGVREVLACGAIAGYPVVDVRVVVYDGKHHSVDSKDIAFATAGRRAFMAAIREARPAVLEPIVQIEIAVPEHSVGDVTSDLSLRRGLVTGTSGLGAGTVAIGGQVPEAEMANYQSRLNAMTSGQGRYTIALSHYEAVPPAVQQTLTEQYQVREDD